MQGFDHRLAADTPQAEVEALLAELNGDARVSGILLQLPTPKHIDGNGLTWLIDPAKDVDGLTPVSAGLLAKGRPGLRPCTPSGCMELLDRHDVELEGAEAVVVGRSDLVGKPVAQMLLARHATVTVCHSRTRDLPEVCRRADVLVAAVGRPRMVQGDWVRAGATVIDVGINRTRRGARRRRRLRGRGRARAADHPGAARCGADDDRDAAAQHAGGRARSGRPAGLMGRLRAGRLDRGRRRRRAARVAVPPLVRRGGRAARGDGLAGVRRARRRARAARARAARRSSSRRRRARARRSRSRSACSPCSPARSPRC